MARPTGLHAIEPLRLPKDNQMNSMKNGAHVAAVITVALLGVPDVASSEVTPQHANVHPDNTIDILDLLQIVGSMHEYCECPEDVNGDGQVNVTDIRQVIMFWGQTVDPIEPETDDGASEIPDVDQHAETVYAGPDPVLLDGIYYDALSRNRNRAELGIELEQGWRTRAHNREYGIDVLPYAYGGGVDYNADMTYSATDLQRFEDWLDEHVPNGYTGPVVLDMEGEWWVRMSNATESEMAEIIDFYIQGLEYAEALRPNAKFGYWGLPKKHMTVDHYTGPSMARLLQASGAIFPDTYETNPGRDDSTRLKKHVERCIELVRGEVPVYTQMFPRHRNAETRQWCYYFDEDEFLRDQARASLDARWVDARGRTHRVAGIAVWDYYNYVRLYHDDWHDLSNREISTLWNEIDARHVELYGALRRLVSEYAVAGDAVADGAKPAVRELPARPKRFAQRRPAQKLQKTQSVKRTVRTTSSSGRGTRGKTR